MSSVGAGEAVTVNVMSSPSVTASASATTLTTGVPSEGASLSVTLT